MSQEVTYYSEGDVQITNARAVLGSQTYAMANITSVSKMKIPPVLRIPGMGIAGFGLLITLCAGAAGSEAAIFGLLVLGVGVAIIAYAKPSYVVMIGTAAGEKKARISGDPERIDEIVAAMNEAIIKRG